jgi:hypothetical protein
VDANCAAFGECIDTAMLHKGKYERVRGSKWQLCLLCFSSFPKFNTRARCPGAVKSSKFHFAFLSGDGDLDIAEN